MTTAIYEGRSRTKAAERDIIIDNIKSIVSTRGYVIEALVEKDHYRLVSKNPAYLDEYFWLDENNRICCEPKYVNAMQILGLNPVVAPTSSLVDAVREAVSKYGYTVLADDEQDAYTLRKEAGGHTVKILVWFDDNNRLRCTRSNVDVLQAMGLNPIAEAEHKAAPSAQATQVAGTHYSDMKIQPWTLMKASFTREEYIAYHIGTVMAYLMRHKAKGGEQDIKKAQHHLTELVEYLNAA